MRCWVARRPRRHRHQGPRALAVNPSRLLATSQSQTALQGRRTMAANARGGRRTLTPVPRAGAAAAIWKARCRHRAATQRWTAQTRPGRPLSTPRKRVQWQARPRLRQRQLKCGSGACWDPAEAAARHRGCPNATQRRTRRTTPRMPGTGTLFRWGHAPHQPHHRRRQAQAGARHQGPVERGAEQASGVDCDAVSRHAARAAVVQELGPRHLWRVRRASFKKCRSPGSGTSGERRLGAHWAEQRHGVCCHTGSTGRAGARPAAGSAPARARRMSLARR